MATPFCYHLGLLLARRQHLLQFTASREVFLECRRYLRRQNIDAIKATLNATHANRIGEMVLSVTSALGWLDERPSWITSAGHDCQDARGPTTSLLCGSTGRVNASTSSSVPRACTR